MGQREGAKVSKGLLDLLSVINEPADYVATIAACVSGDCSVLALGAMVLPFVPGAVGRHADFFVRAVGEAIPATAYRYVSSTAPYLDDLAKTGSIPANPKGSYISFDRFDDPAVAAGKLQVPHDAAILVEFDTLQIVDDVRIPQGQWDTALHLEPLTVDFAKFGPGGATQAITNQPIQARNMWTFVMARCYMDARLSNQDVRKRMNIVRAGIDRFFSEGYMRWSRDNFCKMLCPEISPEDDRVIFTLYGWEDAGIVRFVGQDDVFIEVLRAFP